jgi:hypothetical protein
VGDGITDPDGAAIPPAATISQQAGSDPPPGTLTKTGLTTYRFDATRAGAFQLNLFSIPYVYVVAPEAGTVNACWFFQVTPQPAADDAYNVDQNQTLNVAAPGILGNDDPPPVGAGAATIDTQPENGTVTVDSDGGFRYTPETNFHGLDSFTYRNNGHEATVDLTVNHIEQPPEVTLNSPGCNPLVVCLFADPDNRLNLSAGWPGRLRGFITDPEANAGTLSVNWGDGTSTTAPYPCFGAPGCPFQTTPTYAFACGLSPCEGDPLYFELTHVYADPTVDPTTYNIAATATSDDTLSDSAASTATVVRPLPNAIAFTLPATAFVNDSAPLSATGASSQPVVFSVDGSSGAGVCSIVGTAVTFHAVGTCVVIAAQAGDATHAAATMQRTVTVISGGGSGGGGGGGGGTDPPSVLPETPIGNPQARGIANACPEGRVPPGRFTDVASDDVHRGAIDCVAWWRVAIGTAAVNAGAARAAQQAMVFEPVQTTSRAQMASFLARLVQASGGSLPADSPDAFPDDESSVHEENINALAAVGVIRGLGSGSFGPAQEVSRAQLASFIVRTYEYRTGSSLSSDADFFEDDEGSAHEEDINRAATHGLLAGVGSRQFEPGLSVRRNQMASFLARFLDLLVEEGWASLPA